MRIEQPLNASLSYTPTPKRALELANQTKPWTTAQLSEIDGMLRAYAVAADNKAEELEGQLDDAYERGSASAWTQILATARQNVASRLGALDLDRDDLLVVLSQTVAALRSICEEFGDNDWEDDLHPADVIEMHLARHLR